MDNQQKLKISENSLKAVNNLIIYLTDQRRILSTFMDKDVLTWKILKLIQVIFILNLMVI